MSATKSLSSRVQDGYVTGHLTSRVEKCGRCGKATRVIAIETVVLPEGITLFATILQDPRARAHDEPRCIPNIGIGCGCYGKFHRQLVHIRGR